MRYPDDQFKQASCRIITNCCTERRYVFSQLLGNLQGQVLRWTLILVTQLIPQDGKVDLSEESKDKLTCSEIIDLLEIVAEISLDNKTLQRVGLDQNLLQTISEIYTSKWVQLACGSDQAELEKKQIDLKIAILRCLAALTEKIEEAREDLIHDSKTLEAISKIMQLEMIDSNPKKVHMLIALYTLLTSLGRSKEVNKKIVRETFQEQDVKFIEKIGKQLVDMESNDDLQKELQLAVIKTIANFGLDLKEFIFTKGLLEKLIDIIMSNVDNSTQLTQQKTFSKKDLNEKQCAIFALKNLGFDCKGDGKIEFQKVVTCNFLYKVLDSPQLLNLRE